MIAQIVEAYGRYSSSRGPSYSSYQALKAMNLDDLEGRLLAGLLAPYGDEPTPTQEQIAKALAAQRITQLRKMVEAETKRRTAEQLGRDHVQMYGVPQLAENVEFLRASGEQLRQMRRVVAPLARTLATRLAARRRRSRARRDRPAQDAAQVDVHRRRADRRRAQEAAPGPARAGGAVRRVGLGRRVQPLHAAAGARAAPAVLPGSRLRVHRHHRRGHRTVRARTPTWPVAVQRITREAGVYTRDGHSDYGNAFVSFMEKWPNVLSPRSSLLVLGDGRNNYRNPETDLLAHMVNASRHAHWLNPEPRHLWGSGDSAVPRYAGRHHHARMPLRQAAGLGDRRAAAGLSCPLRARNVYSGRRIASRRLLETQLRTMPLVRAVETAPVSWLFVASRRRLGVMGGTFDPIHNGHLVAASEVADLFELDEVVFVPTGQPWQKRHRYVTAAEDRYLMTVIATASNPRFSVSRVDIDRGGPTYTKDTLRDLRALNPDTDLYFITGADALASILSWQNWEEMFSIARFVGVSRPGYELDGKHIAAAMKELPADALTLVEVPALAISSTDCRKRAEENRPDLVSGARRCRPVRVQTQPVRRPSSLADTRSTAPMSASDEADPDGHGGRAGGRIQARRRRRGDRRVGAAGHHRLLRHRVGVQRAPGQRDRRRGRGEDARRGYKPARREGTREGRWTLLDLSTSWCTSSIRTSATSTRWTGCGATARCPDG